MTEKLFIPLQFDIVPIVFGGANYSFMPPLSYINALEYTPEQLAKYLKKLSDDNNLYQSYFRWKSEYKVEARLDDKPEWFCDICRKLNVANGSYRSYSLSEIANNWKDANCYNWHTNEKVCFD